MTSPKEGSIREVTIEIKTMGARSSQRV